jgi:hypothetical protein
MVWSYSYLEGETFETLDWYSPESILDMSFSVAQIIEAQLYAFYGQFSECFNLADFPDVLYYLPPSERPLFLSAAGVPVDTDAHSVGNYDCFSGLCAVIRHRIKQRSLEQVKSAAELFNWTIDFGLLTCETKSSAVVKVGSVAEVGPSWVLANSQLAQLRLLQRNRPAPMTRLTRPYNRATRLVRDGWSIHHANCRRASIPAAGERHRLGHCP